VAGSNGWYNYRHQADVCHAYQIVSAHGVPDDHIVVMMYDDIAFNKENPTPGKIINKPNGTDVYQGVPKDYTCNAVTPEIFLKALKGEEIVNFGTGKTLKSGPKDNVFVYFTDHGAKGLVGFGQSLLKAHDLNEAILAMHKEQKYNQMVIYIEACESGSMFDGLLPENINVYATTASNSTTSSYACYYDKERRTFLGDVYSIKWMEDSDKENIEKETLEEQYKIVKRETNTSQVCRFGDMSMGKLPVGTFQGPKETIALPPPPPTLHPYPPNFFSCGRDAVPGPQVPVVLLQKKIEESLGTNGEDEARDALNKLMENRKYMEGIVHQIVDVVTNDASQSHTMFSDNVELTQFDCYYAAVDQFHEDCFNVGMNDYALRMLNVFVNMCENNYNEGVIVEAIKSICTHPPVHGIH